MAAENKDGTRKGRTRNERGRFTSSVQPVAEHNQHNPAHANNTSDGAKWHEHTAQLARLFSRADGWLRAVPDFDTGRLYIKWKFTSGRHAGYYVMAVHTLWSFDEAISTLLDKLDAVDCGARRPTRDNYYGDHYDAKRAGVEYRTEKVTEEWS